MQARPESYRRANSKRIHDVEFASRTFGCSGVSWLVFRHQETSHELHEITRIAIHPESVVDRAPRSNSLGDV